MKREKSDNQVDKMLAKHLHCEPAEFDFDRWAEKFPEEAKLAAAGFAGPGSRTRVQLSQIWRTIMTSRYTRYTGLAAALLVGLAFLFPGRNGIVPASIALADVQEAVIEKREARVTGVRNCFFGDDETPTHKLGVEKLFSLSYGYTDRTLSEDGKLLIQFSFHMPSGTVTVLFPTVKKYYRMEIPGKHRDRVQQITPEELFEWLWASGDYRQIGPKQINGVEAVGFEVNDVVERFVGAEGLGLDSRIFNFFFSIKSLNAQMWVDPERRLPIKMEGRGEINPCLITGYRKMKLHEINDQLDFEVDFDESLFNPEIPDDYEQLGVPGIAKASAALYSLGLASIPVILIRVRRRS
jgi:hypothetical protein